MGPRILPRYPNLWGSPRRRLQRPHLFPFARRNYASRQRVEWSKGTSQEHTSPTKQWGTKENVIFYIITASTLLFLYEELVEKKVDKNAFVKFTLDRKEAVSSTASIFYLRPKDATKTKFAQYEEAWRQGVWSVNIKQPQIQIVRAYTPLPPLIRDGSKSEAQQNELRFLIRHGGQGEVSNWLNRLPWGADVEISPIHAEYTVSPEVKEVVFCAGGTGIAPALQVAHAMFAQRGDEKSATDDKDKRRKLHILWANKSRQDCAGGTSDDIATPTKSSWLNLTKKADHVPVPVTTGLLDKKNSIVQELDLLKQRYPGQVSVDYFVDEESTFIDEKTIAKVLSGFRADPSHSSIMLEALRPEFLVSGPDGFISYLVGPKVWTNGKEEQGPVGGLVGHVLSSTKSAQSKVKVWKI